MWKNIAFLFIIIVSLFSCNSENEKSEIVNISNEDIINEIFPELVDSLQIKWVVIQPPPPPPIYNADSSAFVADTILENYITNRHDKYIRKVDSIDSREYIAFRRNFTEIDFENLNNKSKYNFSSFTPIDYSDFSVERLDFGKGYNLHYKPTIYNDYSDFFKHYKNHKFIGILSFSRVFTNNNIGALQLDFYYSPINSYSIFIIIIEKTNGKWGIKEIIKNWAT